MAAGKVSFTFDDGRLSTFTNAFPLLAERGLRGHIAVVTDRVGLHEQYSWGEIAVMVAQGWEVMSHSRTHDFAVMDDTKMWLEVVESRRILESRGFSARVFNMPGGPWSDEDRFAPGSPFDLLVRRTYAAYVPDTDPEFAPHPMADPVDPYALGLLLCECYGWTDVEEPLDVILATLDHCATGGLWAHLMWHDVQGPYVEKLRAVADHALALIEAGKLVEVTVSEALGLD